MKPNDEKVERIEKALKSAYRQSRRILVKPEWERKVMYHILGLHATQFQTNAIWEAPAIWRTATAVSIGALIMLFFTFINNIGPEYEGRAFNA